MAIGPATPRRLGKRERERGNGNVCTQQLERVRCMHGGGRVWGFAVRTMAPARWDLFPGCQGNIVELLFLVFCAATIGLTSA